MAKCDDGLWLVWVEETQQRLASFCVCAFGSKSVCHWAGGLAGLVGSGAKYSREKNPSKSTEGLGEQST